MNLTCIVTPFFTVFDPMLNVNDETSFFISLWDTTNPEKVIQAPEPYCTKPLSKEIDYHLGDRNIAQVEKWQVLARERGDTITIIQTPALVPYL